MPPPSGAPAPSTSPDSSESDFDRLFRVSLDLLCIAGIDGYFRRVNPAWTRALGWSESELLSRPVHEFMHPDDRERTLQARAGLGRGVPLRNFENRYLCKDGGYRWLSWQSIMEPGEQLVFAIARDVTERRQMDEERLIVSKLEATGLFASGLAHDFNNLLAGLLLNVEMLGLSGPLNAEQSRFSRQARDTVLAAKALTEQLLTVAGADAAARETGDLGPVVRDVVDQTLRGSGIRGACVVAPGLWPASFNRTQLTQVMRGLVLNACEASPAGGTVLVHAENHPAGSTLPAELAAGDYLRVSIRDEGTGVPAAVLPRIFDPYFSTKNRGTQKGMGLGLTICRALIVRHGGAITLDSQPGRGTSVTFFLPAVRPPAP